MLFYLYALLVRLSLIMKVTSNTSHGQIKGKKITENVLRFTGIPFAKPPVGELRFKAPVEPVPMTDTKECTEFGPASIQPLDDVETASAGPQSEDCLSLNIWTQGLDDNKKRPVMVWIHGGGFFTGGANDPIYDGTQLAERGDVVLVSIQYRLGALGFLYLDELGGETFSNSKNNGMLDQVAALKWIKNNIQNFGGDPDNVTIFGESAGGASVSLLMVMPQPLAGIGLRLCRSIAGPHRDRPRHHPQHKWCSAQNAWPHTRRHRPVSTNRRRPRGPDDIGPHRH